MPDPPPIEETVAKLVLLAKARGLGIDDLIEMLNSGASMADMVKALTSKPNGPVES